MADRRSLTEGLKATPRALEHAEEKAFVYGNEPKVAAATAQVGSAPLSTRLRADLVTTLKRASLERQLQGIEPHTLRSILEEAVEPWLRSNGYLS